MMWSAVHLSWFWPMCAVTGLVVLCVGIVLFSGWFTHTLDLDSNARQQQSALELARVRLARGGITPAQDETLRRSSTS